MPLREGMGADEVVVGFTDAVLTRQGDVVRSVTAGRHLGHPAALTPAGRRCVKFQGEKQALGFRFSKKQGAAGV